MKIEKVFMTVIVIIMTEKNEDDENSQFDD